MFSKWFCYFKCKGHQFNTVHPTQLPTPVNSVNHGQSGAPQTLFLSVVPHSLRAHFANFFLCPQPKEQNPWHSTTRHQLERLPFLFFYLFFSLENHVEMGKILITALFIISVPFRHSPREGVATCALALTISPTFSQHFSLKMTCLWPFPPSSKRFTQLWNDP